MENLGLRAVELTCPGCEGEHLHHDRVVVRGRFNEDGDGREHRVDADGRFACSREMQANDAAFAGRRSDIEIFFSCENCAARPRLRIIQHKGQTLVRWVFSQPD